jgi:hypothetical protein
MPDERFREDALNRLWNALHDGVVDACAGDLDPAQAETLRRLHGLTIALPPPAARSRVDGAIGVLCIPSVNGRASADASQIQFYVHRPDNARNGQTLPESADRPAPWMAARLGWAAAQVATVCLVLLTLGFGVIALGRGSVALEQLSAIRSAFAPPPPTPRLTIEETLLAATLPAEALPLGDRVSGSLTHFSLAPGAEMTWDGAADDCCPGFRFDYVLEGTLSMRPTGSAHVFRGGASLSPEVVAAGQNFTLAPGDAVMLRYQDAFDSANPEADPVHLLEIAFIDGFFQLHADGPGWDRHFDADIAYGLFVPDRPATLRLQQRDLAPGAVLEPPPDSVTQLGLTLADNAPLDVHNTDSIGNLNDEPVTVHIATLLPEPTGEMDTS